MAIIIMVGNHGEKYLRCWFMLLLVALVFSLKLMCIVVCVIVGAGFWTLAHAGEVLAIFNYVLISSTRHNGRPVEAVCILHTLAVPA